MKDPTPLPQINMEPQKGLSQEWQVPEMRGLFSGVKYIGILLWHVDGNRFHFCSGA